MATALTLTAVRQAQRTCSLTPATRAIPESR